MSLSYILGRKRCRVVSSGALFVPAWYRDLPPNPAVQGNVQDAFTPLRAGSHRLDRRRLELCQTRAMTDDWLFHAFGCVGQRGETRMKLESLPRIPEVSAVTAVQAGG